MNLGQRIGELLERDQNKRIKCDLSDPKPVGELNPPKDVITGLMPKKEPITLFCSRCKQDKIPEEMITENLCSKCYGALLVTGVREKKEKV